MDSTSDHHLGLPPTDMSHCVKVTTIVAQMVTHASPAGTGDSHSLPSSNPEEGKRLQLQSKHFTETNIKDLAAFLEQGVVESTGLVLVFIENWHNWAFESLMDAFPSFPVQLLHEVNGGLGLTMLPVFDDDNIELCYILDNIDIADTPKRTYSRGSMRLGLWEAQHMPIATWVRGQGAFPKFPQRAVAVVLGRSSVISVSDRLFRHYNLRRWNRLNECPYWIYLDAFFVFTNWDSTLEVARFYLENKEQDMFNFGAQSPIFHQTRELHRDASTTLALQEYIRMHQASVKRFHLGLGRMPSSESLKFMQRRLEDVAELLEFYQSTCLTILEQQRNLLNMTFNLETIGQSQAVMRLNALAFVFLPLSFIASIFGMTTITTPAVWYTAVALPTLIATVGAVFVINRATDYLQSRKLKKQQNDQSSSHRGINWNAPQTLLSEITNTGFGGNTTSNILSQDKALSTVPRPPSQQQLELSTGVLDRQSLRQKQPEASIQIPDGHLPGQLQPKASTGVLNNQSPSQQQSKASTGVLDRQSPSQHQLKPSMGVANRRPRIIIDGDEENLDSNSPEYIRNTPVLGPSSNNVSSSMTLGFRVTGVARVDSNRLTADKYAGAATGAMNSPSGSLRHYV